MPLNAALRTAVWNSMLRAEMNAVYWAKMVRRSYNKERFCKFVLLATSSSTVAGWGIWEQVSLVWKGLSAFSALLAIALPIINWTKHIAERSDLTGKWLQLAADLNSLWIKVEGEQGTDTELQAIYDTLISKEAAAATAEGQQGVNKAVLQEAYNEVLQTRGLTRKK